MQIGQAAGSADGKYFYTQDSRLGLNKHPRVIKSADITDTCRRPKGRTVRLDYGEGGDGRLYVEVAVYKPHEHVHWTYYAFDVLALIDGQRPESFRLMTRLLRVPQTLFVLAIAKHMK